MKKFMRRRGTSRRLGDIYGEWNEAQWAPAASEAGNYRFVALQPIFDRRKKIFGYEALSRIKWENRFTGDPSTATQTMIDDWLVHGLHELTRSRRTFINLTTEAVIGELWTLLPTCTTLELLETVEPTMEVVSACRKMKSLGYQIALDDFQLSEKMNVLLGLADYVKVDFRVLDSEKRREIVSRVKGLGTVPVAEKIETRDEFDVAVAEGFQLFQGHSLGRPVLFSKRRISPLEAGSLRETRMTVLG